MYRDSWGRLPSEIVCARVRIGGVYTQVDVAGGPGLGMLTSPVSGAPPHWLVYIGVADLDATARRVEQLGGKVVQARIDVPGMGGRS